MSRSSAQPVTTRALQTVTQALNDTDALVGAIRRIADYPLTGHQIHVTAHSAVADTHLRAALAHAAASENIDVAIEPVGRTKKVVMFDVDSTLVQGEVIEMLAAKAGTEAQVREITAAAMRGEIDFAQALQQRVATLAGLDASVLAEVADNPAHPRRTHHDPHTAPARVPLRRGHRRLRTSHQSPHP